MMNKPSDLVNRERPSVEKQLLFTCAKCKRHASSEADNSNFKLCSGCYKVHYCNKECQLADRKNHKIACKAVKANNSSSSVIVPTKAFYSNLLSCCGNGDIEGLRKVISRGGYINTLSSEHLFEAFYTLIRQNYYECAELLLQCNANPNVTCCDGFTPLHVACQEGYEEFVPLLLQYNADPNIRTRKAGCSALIAACQRGGDECVSLLLQHKADPNILNKSGATPLHFACGNGHEKCVSLMLQYKADPNIVDNDCHTSLFLSCQNGQDKCVLLLLQHNANPDIVNEEEVSPLHAACQHGHDKCLSTLLQHVGGSTLHAMNTGESSFISACFGGHLKCAALLVEYSSQNNPLEYSMYYSNMHILQSALQVSCMSRNVNMVAYILSLGADVNASDSYGVTPIQYCYAHGFDKCVKLFIEHGADESNMKTAIPAALRMDQEFMNEMNAGCKEFRQNAKHCDYPDCCNEGNDSQPLHACSSCRAVYYCSREHQAAHWKDHKKLCKAIKK